MSRVLSLVVLAVLSAACGGGREAPAIEPSEPFETAAVTLRSPDGESVELPVYVAADSTSRSLGLMEREELPEGTGMVFLFPGGASSSFYMYRTRIPLSIAFYGEDGEVLRVLDMEPCTSEDSAECERYDPGVTYRGAIEVNQGFFDQVGVAEGWNVELPGDLPTPS